MQKDIFQYCSLIVILLFNAELKAQTIENSINQYGADFPQEKIHMHFDKESYLPGETIWFKAYLFEENLPSERSTNFYAALYDENGKMVQQQISPIYKSSSDGYFIIPDSLPSTQLMCRAYTTWMLNFDTGMLFTKVIKIINSKTPAENNKINKTAALHFFPEGGDIIVGVKNTIAFKANYNNGLPFHVEGVIKKQETGEMVMPLKVVHDGMGKFNLEFGPGDKYYAEWTDNNGTKQITWLPDAKTKGVSLKLSQQADKLYFNLVNKTGRDSLHILMYMYQKVFYKTNLSLPDAEPYTGIIPVGSLPSGTMQMTVFDVNWQPVAERVTFINNNNFIIDAGLFAKETSLQKRGKNIIEILITDTVPANMSLSISDAELNNAASENTIVSNFLLKGDLKGYIHNPAYYFTDHVDALLKAKLDLVMLTNGWRRYNWDNMMAKRMPAVNSSVDVYLTVYGQIGKEAMNKIGKDEVVNLIIKTKDSSSYFYSIEPARNGLLKRNRLIFSDTARVYYTFNKNRNLNQQMTFSNSNFTDIQPTAIDNYSDYFLPVTGNALFLSSASFNYYNTNSGINKNKNVKTLETVQLKTSRKQGLWYWNNKGLEEIEKKYANGYFRGFNNGYGIDVLHDEMAKMDLDIAHYIGKKIPDMWVRGSAVQGYSLTYRNGVSVVYLDGLLSNYGELMTIPLNEVAYIKFFDQNPDASTLRYPEIMWTSAIVVYTRKGNDVLRDRTFKVTNLGYVKVAGYTAVKEFYEPDYALENTNATADSRTTLLWAPYILTNAGNRKVPVTFYNNDFTKKFRIVLEGINEEGKMIHIEKIIE